MVVDQNVRTQVLDVTKSFLVQAPAGSGKTSLLVQRFLSVLAIAESDPEEILAITFTRKAAAEMRERILDALQLGLQDTSPEDAYDFSIWHLSRKVLQRDSQAGWNLFQNPARLKILTIDALCASITQQMPILSRFGAQPQIEPKPANLYNRAIDLLLKALDDATGSHAALFNLLSYLDNDRAKIRSLLRGMLSRRDQWLPKLTSMRGMENIRSLLEESLAQTIHETLDQVAAAIPLELDFALMQVAYPASQNAWLDLANLLLTEKNTWRKRVAKKEGLQGHEDFRQGLIAVKNLPPPCYTDQQWNIVESLLKVLPELAAHLTVVFRDHGQVDFVEVALAALKALADQDAPSDLALSLDCKISHILVDEFQDTSHTQYTLLEHLTASWDPYEGRTLFLVGDPMQSIYRFRQAEVGLFLKAKQYGINQIELNFVQLKVNFRANSNLIQWINRVFAHSFPATDDMVLGSITYMPALASDANADDAHKVPVECYAVATAAEAAKIAEIIAITRAKQPDASIAILVRVKSHLLNVLPVLRAANIGFQAVELETLQQNPLIQDLLAITQAILHLDDRIAWLAILRAPWCALNLADLQVIAHANSTIWDAIQDPEVQHSLGSKSRIRLHRLIAVMSDALLQLNRLTLDVLVKQTWQNLGGKYCLSHTDDQLIAAAFFTLLADLNNKREIWQPEFLYQQLQNLFLPSAVIDKQAVQVMTMHKAKGLEFDVVILPSLAKETRHDDPQLFLLDSRDYQNETLLLAPIRAASEEQDPIYSYLYWCEKQRQQFESLRLLYVAVTRARSKIYCLADVTANKNVGGLLGKIWSIVADEFITVDPQITASVVSEVKLRRLPLNWYAQNLYSSDTLPTQAVTYEHTQPDWLRVTGTVMHRIFWQVAQGTHTNSATWQQQLQQLCLSPQYMQQALELLQQAVLNTTHDAIGQMILSTEHKESFAEWRLTIAKDNGCQQVILDRAFLTYDDIFWIVDYKLVHDDTAIAAAIDLYTPQINKYVQAVTRLRPNTQIVAGLYFPLQAKWQPISNNHD